MGGSFGSELVDFNGLIGLEYGLSAKVSTGACRGPTSMVPVKALFLKGWSRLASLIGLGTLTDI